MREYNFVATWVHKIIEGETHDEEFMVEAYTEQEAYEKAFNKAMEIHKNTAKESPYFNRKWMFGGIHLMYVV